MTIFHRLERYGHSGPLENTYIIVSYETQHRGLWQCKFSNSGLRELDAEPPFESLTAEEQRAVKEIGAIVYYFTHEELPEGLNIYNT